MSNFFDWINIENFKSIRQLRLDCRRVNLIIGKPNVGKSNLLEAISLFAASYSRNPQKFMVELIRYDGISNLFYDQNLENKIFVDSNLVGAKLNYNFEDQVFRLFISSDRPTIKDFYDSHKDYASQFKRESLEKVYFSSFFQEFQNYGNILDIRNWREYLKANANIKYALVKKYSFPRGFSKDFDKRELFNINSLFLFPPYGENLFTIFQTNPELRKEASAFFKKYGLELVFDVQNRKLEIQKKEGDLVYKIPYNLTADTLQRIIFHYAAIESNKNSVILFEEPENHSFPPYIRDLALKIIESKENQFFITTHSPYLFNTIIENINLNDLAIFVTKFEDYQTSVVRLNKEQIQEMSDYGVDVFFNLSMF